MTKILQITPGNTNRLIILLVVFMLTGCSSPQGSTDATNSGEKPTHIPTREPVPTSSPTAIPSPDMNGESFVIHVISLDQEPFSPVNEIVQNGLEDYASFRNANGGINGGVLEIEFSEVQEDGDELINKYESLAENGKLLAVLMLAPINQDLYDLINSIEIPVIYFGLGAEQLSLNAEEDHLFWLVPTPDQQLKFWLRYALRNWKDLRPEGQFDVMRLCHISWEDTEPDPEQSAALRTMVEAEQIVFASEGKLPQTPNASSANPILEGVFNQATMIYMDLFSFGPASVSNDLHYLDLGGMFNVAGSSWSLGIDLVEYLPEIEDGQAIYSPLPVAWWSETNNPGILQAEQIFSAAGREEDEKTLAYLYAISGVDLVAAALEDALYSKQGSIDVSLRAEDLLSAFSEMEGYRVLDGLFTVDFAHGLRAPGELRVWKYTPGEGFSIESENLPILEND